MTPDAASSLATLDRTWIGRALSLIRSGFSWTRDRRARVRREIANGWIFLRSRSVIRLARYDPDVTRSGVRGHGTQTARHLMWGHGSRGVFPSREDSEYRPRSRLPARMRSGRDTHRIRSRDSSERARGSRRLIPPRQEPDSDPRHGSARQQDPATALGRRHLVTARCGSQTAMARSADSRLRPSRSRRPPSPGVGSTACLGAMSLVSVGYARWVLRPGPPLS
jgi:hypothetical protein